MHPQRVESLSHAQRERLAYVDFRLYFMGEIGRPDSGEPIWRCPGWCNARFGAVPGNRAAEHRVRRQQQGLPHRKGLLPDLRARAAACLVGAVSGFGDGVIARRSRCFPANPPPP
jgi:hypothetical protein